MPFLQIKRLPPNVAEGFVLKVFLRTKLSDEKERALHVLISIGRLKSRVLLHYHSTGSGISEGYRQWNWKTFSWNDWEVVGDGFFKKGHSIPYTGSGIKIVLGSKREPGIESWPEIWSKLL